MPLWKPAVWTVVLLVFAPAILLKAVDKPFHDAPDSAKTEKNPYAGQQAAVDAGKTVYARNCLSCHGRTDRNWQCSFSGRWQIEGRDRRRNLLVRHQGR